MRVLDMHKGRFRVDFGEWWGFLRLDKYGKPFIHLFNTGVE